MWDALHGRFDGLPSQVKWKPHGLQSFFDLWKLPMLTPADFECKRSASFIELEFGGPIFTVAWQPRDSVERELDTSDNVLTVSDSKLGTSCRTASLRPALKLGGAELGRFGKLDSM
mmetsp:Transcript_39370/g.73869  ORF Transcript_39370/g.73869 Transcript_39370/m.73869 type:complete len:116 (-) Transcript_39370:114-461(-)